MDAATLFIVLQINGKDREEQPRQFPDTAACEAHVADLKQKLEGLPFQGSIKSYECMRWYALSK